MRRHRALPGTEAAESGGEASDTPGETEPSKHNVDVTIRVKESGDTGAAIAEEARKGYGLLFIGREPASEGNRFTEQITRSAASFAGPIAITIARGERSVGNQNRPLNILVPVTGTPVSRQGAELAVALAQGSRGNVTALHVAGVSSRERPRWGVRLGATLAPDSSADATIQEIIELGKAYGVEVKGTIRSRRTAENAIIREMRSGNYDLLVMGVSPPSRRPAFLRRSVRGSARAVTLLAGFRRQRVGGGRSHDRLVNEAPAPILSRLEGLDDRMARSVEMSGGVPIGRIVATPHVTAGQAQTQVHPFPAHFQAILASFRAGCDFADFFQMWIAHEITSNSGMGSASTAA